MTKKEKEILKTLVIGDKSEIITNRFSGRQVELCPAAVALYNAIMDSERDLIRNSLFGFYMNNKEYDHLFILFDTARDVFRRNFPKEYIILLD